MTATISPADWLGFVERDYLSSYIADTGASVKFAVPMDGASRALLISGIRSVSETLGYLVLTADAAVTRVHMVDQLFFNLADQVPWSHLCRRVLGSLATESGYRVPDGPTLGPFEDVIAEANGLDRDWVRNELRGSLVKGVFKDATLARDFRVAVTRLCMAELTGGPEGATTTEVVTDWLSGRNRAVAAVKPYGIQARIQRTNARYFLESLFIWIRHAGRRGTVVLLDTQQLTLAKNPRDGTVFYSKAAVLDAYELLRQFIDDIDNLHAFLMIVVPGHEFLEVEMPTRGMGCYEALKFRVYDEIRDRDLVNPMASLIRLSEQ